MSLSVSARLEPGGWAGTLQGASRAVCFGDVTGIYHRRPTVFQFFSDMPEAEQGWAGAEARMGLGGILSAMTCWLALSGLASYPTRQSGLLPTCSKNG